MRYTIIVNLIVSISFHYQNTISFVVETSKNEYWEFCLGKLHQSYFSEKFPYIRCLNRIENLLVNFLRGRASIFSYLKLINVADGESRWFTTKFKWFGAFVVLEVLLREQNIFNPSFSCSTQHPFADDWLIFLYLPRHVGILLPMIIDLLLSEYLI